VRRSRSLENGRARPEIGKPKSSKRRHRSQLHAPLGQPWVHAASVNWFIPAPRARNRSTRKGVPTYRIVVAEIDRRRRARANSGSSREADRANPKRETAPGETTPHVGSRWQNREIGMGRGACEHLGDGLRKESVRRRTRTVGDSERREPVSANTRSSETGDRVCAQSDRWKPLRGAEFVHFSRVNGESVLGRTDPYFRRSERSGNAQARRQKRQRLARFKDERRTQTSRSSAESKIASLAEDNADEEKRVESPKRVERRENAPCTECANA